MSNIYVNAPPQAMRIMTLLADQLRLMASAYPDKIGYTLADTGESLSFGAWDAAANRVARGLVAAGVAPGERVSIFLPDRSLIAWITAYPAIHRAGAVAVPTNTRLHPDELAAILNHAGASAVITSPQLRSTIDAIAGRLPDLRLIDQGDSLPVEGVAADDDSPFQVPVAGDDLADIMYTSGTTGLPKGVAIRHDDLALVAPSEPTFTGKSWLHGSPLFTFAGIGFIFNPMKLGMAGLYLAHFDAGAWIGHVEQCRPAATFLVPAMAKLISSHPRFAEADLSSLEICAIGSAPLPFEVLKAFQEKLPDATVSNGYGMTEAGAAYCVLPKGEALRRPGSVGRPLPPTEIRVVDDHDVDVPTGEDGEVLIRIKGRQREYYRDPEATARTWAGGWLHTGDLGRLDADGYLYIAGRKKDVIIRGGHNVHAADVEAVLHQHPGVLDAAVVGLPHDVLGEDIAAAVIARDGYGLDPDDVVAFCRARLADYKSPRRVVVLDELPRNATGKVLKRALVSRLEERPTRSRGSG
jgi:acyl-CoA synthetase (AMP-forming)/AMP-acid ligase II